MRDAFDGLTTVGSGSYAPDDVHFLLRAMDIDVTDVEEKERLIQTAPLFGNDQSGTPAV